MGYIGVSGYYEGDRAGADLEVANRPSFRHVWDGIQWVLGPEPVPRQVTMRQARQQLFIDGLLGSVDTIIASLPSPQKELAQIEWDKSQFVERSRPLVAALGAALGLTTAQLDQLFINAARL